MYKWLTWWLRLNLLVCEAVADEPDASCAWWWTAALTGDSESATDMITAGTAAAIESERSTLIGASPTDPPFSMSTLLLSLGLLPPLRLFKLALLALLLLSSVSDECCWCLSTTDSLLCSDVIMLKLCASLFVFFSFSNDLLFINFVDEICLRINDTITHNSQKAGAGTGGGGGGQEQKREWVDLARMVV